MEALVPWMERAFPSWDAVCQAGLGPGLAAERGQNDRSGQGSSGLLFLPLGCPSCILTHPSSASLGSQGGTPALQCPPDVLRASVHHVQPPCGPLASPTPWPRDHLHGEVYHVVNLCGCWASGFWPRSPPAATQKERDITLEWQFRWWPGRHVISGRKVPLPGDNLLSAANPHRRLRALTSKFKDLVSLKCSLLRPPIILALVGVIRHPR